MNKHTLIPFFIECPVAGPTILNGVYMIPTSPIVGTTAKLICNPMYEVSGEPSICCQADGSWTSGGSCERGLYTLYDIVKFVVCFVSQIKIANITRQ